MDYSKITYIILPLVGFIISLKSTKPFVKIVSLLFFVSILLFSMFTGIFSVIGLIIF